MTDSTVTHTIATETTSPRDTTSTTDTTVSATTATATPVTDGAVGPVTAGGADLHLHTTASDGTLSPADMVALARRQGLQAIAITDHDTIGGLGEAIQAGTGLGVTVIPGVELSCEVQGGVEVHILGYLCRFDDGPLADLLADLRQGRRRRAETAVAQLRAQGIPIDLDRVLALGHDAVGRPHLAAALVEIGAASSLQEAFKRYLVRGRPGYAPRPKLTLGQAVSALRAADGVAVVAHPGLIGDDRWVSAALEAGAEGVEVYHSDHTPAHRQRYAGLAAERGLLVTGGSDSHGDRGMRPVLPGHVRISLAAVAALQERVKRR